MIYPTQVLAPASLSPARALPGGSPHSPFQPSPTAVAAPSPPPSTLFTPTPPRLTIKVNSIVALAPAPSTPHGPFLVCSVPLTASSPALGRGVKRPTDALADDDGLWHCSLGCGTLYEKSSGRSIRRHMTLCFRSHWPGGQELSESEVQALMSSQQESGQLVTGLRRWKKRQSCRPTLDLDEDETWTCPNGCGKVYRLSSSRSIQQHVLACGVHALSSIEECAPTTVEPQPENRAPAASTTSSTGDRALAVQHHSGTIAFSTDRPVYNPMTPDLVLEWDETTGAAHTPSSRASNIPGQFDGTADDASFMEESDHSNYDDNMHGLVFAPSTVTAQNPLFAYSWEDTPLCVLLRRHQERPPGGRSGAARGDRSGLLSGYTRSMVARAHVDGRTGPREESVVGAGGEVMD